MCEPPTKPEDFEVTEDFNEEPLELYEGAEDFETNPPELLDEDDDGWELDEDDFEEEPLELLDEDDVDGWELLEEL